MLFNLSINTKVIGRGFNKHI